MKLDEEILFLLDNIKKKKEVVGLIISQQSSFLFIDIFLTQNTHAFSNGNLEYSTFKKTYFIYFYYHKIHELSKNSDIHFIFLKRLENASILYDESKKLKYFQKLLQSDFDNPLKKMLKKKNRNHF